MKKIRSLIRNILFLRQFIGYHLSSSGLFDFYFKNYKLDENWIKRLNDIIYCNDVQYIDKVKGAGEIFLGKQRMHNGLLINLGSYYGPEYSVVLAASGGIHEPQEERIFAEVLKILPSNAVMVEMGAFWSFYSMWFNSKVINARNLMIEPDSFNLGQGKRNFKLNKLKGTFIQSFIGKESVYPSNGVPTLSLDDIIIRNKIDFIDILHSDIQGFEYDMLIGAHNALINNNIGYIFISTHSDEVHYKCLNLILQYNYKIHTSVDLMETFSEDGLIVAYSNNYKQIDKIELHLKNSNTL
jgi:hypothetical protein